MIKDEFDDARERKKKLRKISPNSKIVKCAVQKNNYKVSKQNFKTDRVAVKNWLLTCGLWVSESTNQSDLI